MEQFRKPCGWKKQRNPQTPLPPCFADRHTDRLEKEKYLRELANALEDTGKHIIISAPQRSEFTKDGLEDMPHLLVYGAVCHHIGLRSDKVPPQEIWVSHANYMKLIEFMSLQSFEGFTGKYLFVAYDGTESVQIALYHDFMPHVNEAIPVNTVICIH